MDSKSINPTKQYLSMLTNELIEGYIYLYLPDSNQVHWYELAEIETLISDAMSLKHKTVFIGAHPSKTPKTSRQRAKRDDICAVSIIPLDFDVANANAHKKTDLPQSKEEVLHFLKDLGLGDKITLYNSGYGLHGYFQLDTPFLITDEESRVRAENLTKGVNRYIKVEAKKRYDWNLDNVGDLPRVMRLGGSYNHKGGKPKLVTPLHISDHRFSIEELEVLIPSPSQPKQNANENLLKAWVKQVEKSDKKAQIEPIIAGCRFVRHCITDAATLSEPHWHALITITARCENGEEVSQRASKPYVNYNSQETAKKVAAAKVAASGPVTCKYMREQLLFPACRTCPLAASKMKSPIALGFVDGYLAGLFSSFVYDLKTKRFYEINPPMEALA